MKIALMNAVLVGTGGFFGSLFRYSLSGLVHRKVPATSFPIGTLGVNLLGCLLIGLMFGVIESRHLLHPGFRGFLVVGLLGGFTTYSAFGYETFVLIRDGEPLRATANVAAHILLGLLCVWVGYALSSSVVS